MGKKRHNRDKVHPWFKWFMLVKPQAATGEVWDRWERIARSRRRIRYFLQETLPLHIALLNRRFKNAIWWLRYRTTDKMHVVKTDLKPQYHDSETRMLHACFGILVEHVEDALAGRNYDFWCAKLPEWVRPPEDYFESKTLKDHGKAFIRRWFFPNKKGPEAGLDYLRWSTTDEEVLTHNPEQAARDLKIIRLYNWWVIERQQRIDMFADERIWAAVTKPKTVNQVIMSFNRGPSSSYNAACEIARRTEEFYRRQDQAMLEELIRVRGGGLWA